MKSQWHNAVRFVLLVCGFCLLSGCVTVEPVQGTAPATPKIDRVFFGQQHVLAPDAPYFKLVGGLETLIKVQVYADTPTPSPSVFACLELDGNRRDIALIGPAMLPRHPVGDPVLMDQTYADSFTAMIPARWIKHGLKVAVELRDYDYSDVGSDDVTYTNCVPGHYITVLDRVAFDDLKIGAPTRLVIQMFDIHYFGRGDGADLPEGWQSELEARLPVSDMVVHRVRDVVFDEIVMPPANERPSARYTGLADYKQRTGLEYDGEQGIALRWASALKAAGGTFRFWRPYHINICGLPCGGQGGGYRSCGSIHRHGVMIHELGHTFGLPHWTQGRQYPYTWTQYGEERGEPTGPNVGPAWAFDVGRREFVAPWTLVDGKREWKKDPMAGGGWAREKEHLFRFFSDYSISRIQSCFEDRAAYWNESLGAYARWNPESGAYDEVVENDGVTFPVERDADVISVMVTANLVVPEANIVYPPIGPYTAGLIRRFDANSADDRASAAACGYAPEGCNVAMRVTQGGKTTCYLLPVRLSPDDDPLRTFNVAALNLPARDGAVTRVDVLYSPDLMDAGVAASSKIQASWDAAR